MKVIFDGRHTTIESGGQRGVGSKTGWGKHNSTRGLPKKPVAWVGTMIVKGTAGDQVSGEWSTLPGQKLNYIEARTSMMTLADSLAAEYVKDFGKPPDMVTFVMVSS